MTTRTYNVLFLCTQNSARSIMAEAILNQIGGQRFRGFSAGSRPAGSVHPYALDLLQRNRFSIEGLRSKSWDEFASPGAPQMDLILTVCHKAAGETCPVWPGQPLSANWGIADPAEATGSEEAREKAFTDAFMALRARVALLVNLSIDKLDRMSLLNEVKSIGQQEHYGVRQAPGAAEGANRTY